MGFKHLERIYCSHVNIMKVYITSGAIFTVNNALNADWERGLHVEWNAVWNCRRGGACRFCGTCVTACGAFLLLACISAIGGLIWVHIELKTDFDALQAQLMKGKRLRGRWWCYNNLGVKISHHGCMLIVLIFAWYFRVLNSHPFALSCSVLF